MKQSKYLITGDDISTMGLTPLPGKSQLSGKTVLTKKDIVDNYYASVSGITEDNRCVTFERVTSSVYITLSKSTVSLTAAGGSDTVTIDTNLDASLISLNTVSGFTVSRNGKTITITASNLGTNYTSERKEILTISGGGQSTSCTITQEENIPTYSDLTGGSAIVEDIPAKGGSMTATVTNMSQTVSYTSKVSRAGTVTYSQSSAISGSNLGTTPKERTKLGTIIVTFKGEGNKTATEAVDVYQVKNEVINSNYNPHITAYGTPSISIGSGITAAGGSAIVSHSVSNTETYYDYWTSETVGPAKTRSVSGTSTISITANGNNRFSLSGNTVSHSSMTTNAVTDTVTVTAKNAGDSTKTKAASVSVTNNRKVQGTSGGVVTYENVIAGTITNKTIPASGGSATATAGNGSQKWNKTAVVTTYIYDSGSTKNETTTAATSGTDTISPSIASITGSASSKGTTESGQTTIKSQAVTWTGQGNKSASGTMYIYQAANSITSKDMEFDNLLDKYENSFDDVYWYLASECHLVSKYSSGASTSMPIGEPGASAYPLRCKIELTSTSDSNISTNGYSQISFSFPNQSETTTRSATAKITVYLDPNDLGWNACVRTITIIQGTKPKVQKYAVHLTNQSDGNIKVTPTGDPADVGLPRIIYAGQQGDFYYTEDSSGVGIKGFQIDYLSGQGNSFKIYGGDFLLLSPDIINSSQVMFYSTPDFESYINTAGGVTLRK